MSVKHLIKKRSSGVIALTTLLVITSILTLSGLTLILTGIDLGRIAESSSSAFLAEAKSQSCLEEALIQIAKYDNDYTGTINITLDEGSCEATVVDSINTDIKDVSVQGDFNDFTYTSNHSVDISKNPPDLQNN